MIMIKKLNDNFTTMDIVFMVAFSITLIVGCLADDNIMSTISSVSLWSIVIINHLDRINDKIDRIITTYDTHIDEFK